MSEKLEYYEKIYYGSQVEGRNIKAPGELVESFELMSGEYEETVGHFLPENRSIKCLDLACGYGNFLYFLRKMGFGNSVGVDLDERQVALARSINLEARTADASETLNAAKNLGLVSALDLIEHMDKNDAVRLLKKIYSSLEVGGILILRCPCTDGFTGAHDMTNDLTHRWSPSSNMLRQLLRTVGFKSVKIIDISMPPYPRTLGRKMMMLIRRFLRLLISYALRIIGINPPRVWSNSQYAIAWK